jgi:hypothetical protein
MTRTILFLFALCAVPLAFGQRAYKQSKSRNDYFGGARDYRDLSNHGLQVSLGPNATFVRLNNPTEESDPSLANRFSYTIDPMTRIGFFAEVGMVHYRMKKPAWLKRNIIHYIDWGVGFDYIGGKEQTNIDYLDAAGNSIGTATGKASFYNGYVYGRLTAHRLAKLSDKLHLDYGLGFNLDYEVLSSEGRDSVYIPGTDYYQKPFVAQLHAQLGLNIRLSRGDYLVPGVWAPFLGVYEWNSGKPTVQWFSSEYLPVHFQIKWLHSFSKKSNGCNTGSEQDRKSNEIYQQNQ